MTPKVADRAVLRLSGLLLERVGLRPSAEGGAALKLALAARLEALEESDAEAYVSRLEGERGEAELRALLPLVTVGKTEFFRDANQFRALREAVLPALLAQARAQMRRLRIWSAGCATGEEAWSLAMVLAELGVEVQGADILATDVNPQALEVAQRARYPARRASGLTEQQLLRHFVPRGDAFEACDELKARVRFCAHNLAEVRPFPKPWDGPAWDLILCRNVLIYFERLSMLRVLRRFHEGLSEGGFLCLGYSESLFKVSSEFELAEVGGAFLYRRATRHRAQARPEPAAVPTLRWPDPGARPTPPHRASASHPAALAPPPPARAREAEPRVRTMSGEIAAAGEPLSDAHRLLEEGGFDAAALLLEQALAQAPSNLALLLTHGNAMMMLGRHEDALADFRQAREVEALCAEAHLFLGIACAEAAPPLVEEATRELSQALFLDPHLALAHYWTGRLAERQGDRSAARRAYRNAIDACRRRKVPMPLLGLVPDLPSDPALLSRAARYALAALDDR